MKSWSVSFVLVATCAVTLVAQSATDPRDGVLRAIDGRRDTYADIAKQI